jgi:hypothetical protein
MKKSKITAEEIESSLDAFCKRLASPRVAIDVVPPGWFTVYQLAAELDKSAITISERIRKMVIDGEAERQNFTIQLEQVARKVAHYRLLKK